MGTNRDNLTPPPDGEALAIPPVCDIPDAVRRNIERRPQRGLARLGVPCSELIGRARAEMIELALAYTASLGADVRTLGPGAEPGANRLPVVATGHQPELIHPGIWLKNHLAAEIARAVSGIGINFIVDNDAVDLGELAVPAADANGLRVEHLPLASCPRDTAAEEVVVIPAARDALAAAVNAARTALGDLPLADEFVDAADPADRSLADFVSRPRRRIEESFGVFNLELPVSRLARTEAFRLYAAHILANADEFAAAYNAALDRHRAENGIRNPIEPSPNLTRADGRIETPFWVWRAGEPRQPLVVRSDAACLTLYYAKAEAAGIAADELRDPQRAVAALQSLEASGFRIRPRALVMTAFFRLFACDLFIHGLGGARYEPVNDAVLRTFWHADPPEWAAASGTLLLRPAAPLPESPPPEQLKQRLHRMKTMPEQFVGEFIPGDAEAQRLAERRAELADLSKFPRADRHAAFVESKEIAAQLCGKLRPHIAAAEEELGRAGRLDAIRRQVSGRGFPFFFQSRARLDQLFAQIKFAEPHRNQP